MPYTKNTRIKVTHKRTYKEYEAQVEYRIPFTKIKWWMPFDKIDASLPQLMFNRSPLPYEAYWKAVRKYPEECGPEWAQKIIDTYLEMVQDKEHKDTVEYIKYP